MTTVGSAMAIQQAFGAVHGVLGPRPMLYLDPGVVLVWDGGTLYGPDDVATALRELTAGARDIHLHVTERQACATWVLSQARSSTIVVLEFDVDEGRISTVRARLVETSLERTVMEADSTAVASLA